MKQKKSFLELLKSDGFSSFIVVILGFIVGTLLILIIGKNPVGMYKSIFQVLTGLYQNKRGEWVWNVRYIGEWLNISVPYILCGLSMGFAAKAGLFNIGGEGQYIVGLTIAQVIALQGPQIPVLHWVIAIICAILLGAIWGGVVGFFKARYEVSEVVSTIMLNYIALYLSRIVTVSLPGTNTYKTVDFPATASLRTGFLSSLTNGSALNIGFFIVFIALIIYWVLIEKTKTGFALRATGYNKDAAKCSGISVILSVIISMGIAGAFAGLAGGIVALGSFKFGRVISSMDNYGFNGIAVALVGNSSAVGTLLAGLLFGLLASIQPLMQSQQIPKDIVCIIQGLIVVFIAFRSGLKIFVNWYEKKITLKQEKKND